ncbi:HD domain-containing protein [Candidatus Saccharibacteria bacterium]|nr:HD domain-containing protein [Candidatus Saccharibacteria bacterium]
MTKVINKLVRDKIAKSVQEILGNDQSGHGFDHVLRVRDLALDFAEVEGADKEIVELAALLHDVDDYKLFGKEAAKTLPNARRILTENNIDEETATKVLEIISTMGYGKSLEGIRPTTLEGQVVSDADMCDNGARGILRPHAFGLAHRQVFFDRTIPPPSDSNISPEKYQASKKEHVVQHYFNKLLRIHLILLTDAGRAEGAKRYQTMVEFLRAFFREEKADDWAKYLEEFIKELEEK